MSVDTQKLRASTVYPLSRSRSVFDQPSPHLHQGGPEVSAPLYPSLGRSSGGGTGNPLQYSSLENPMDRGLWGCEELDTT